MRDRGSLDPTRACQRHLFSQGEIRRELGEVWGRLGGEAWKDSNCEIKLVESDGASRLGEGEGFRTLTWVLKIAELSL